MGHFKRYYPQLLGGSRQGLVPLIAPSTSFPIPSQDATSGVASRGTGGRNTGGRGASQAGRGQPRLYALISQDAQTSNALVAGILQICSIDAHVLFDPGSTHSYVSLYLAFRFCEPSTRLKSFVVSMYGIDALVDLMLLEMVDFNVVPGMD